MSIVPDPWMMPWLPLQTCSSALDCWGQGEFFQAMATRIEVVIGMAAFMMVVCSVIYIALYWWSKSYVVPTVTLVLTGGAVVSTLPAPVARVGWIIILLAGSLGLFGLLWAVIR
jgi:hypothetical protein